MKFDSEKLKCLFVQVRPEAWGDGLETVRVLRGWKRAHPESVVYHVAHPQVSDAFGAQLVFEGLVDSTLTSIRASDREDVLNDVWELSDRLSSVTFDMAIFARCYGVPPAVLVVAFRAKKLLAAYCTKDTWKHLSPDPPLFAENMGEEARALDIEESIASLSGILGSSVVALFPYTTRPYSTVHEKVWRRIAQMLLDRGHDVLLLGKSLPTWLPRANKLEHWESLCESTKHAFEDLPIFSAMGWSSPKQVLLLRRCRFAVVTMTGASMLPTLYEVPCLTIEAGDNDVAAEILRAYDRPLASYRSACERFPCSRLGMLSQCRSSGRPACLSPEEFDFKAFNTALNECEEKFCAGDHDLQPHAIPDALRCDAERDVRSAPAAV